MELSQNKLQNEMMQALMELSTLEAKQEYLKAHTGEFTVLCDADKKAFMESLRTGTTEVLKASKNTMVLNSVRKVSDFLSFAKIAEVYFGKSRHWLYQRLNNYQINGKTACLAPDDVEVLSVALDDLAEKLKAIAVELKSINR